MNKTKEPYQGFDKDKAVVIKLVERHLGHHAYPNGLRLVDISINNRLKDSQVLVPKNFTQRGAALVLTELVGTNVSVNYIREFFANAHAIGLYNAITAAKAKTHPLRFTVGDVARRISERMTIT